MVDYRVEKAVKHLQKKGVRFADVRLNHYKYLGQCTFDGDYLANCFSGTFGMGVRVLYENGWGFAGGSPDGWEENADTALELAQASNRFNKYRKRIELEEIECAPKDLDYSQQNVENPFKIPRKAIVEYVAEVTSSLKKPQVDSTCFFLEFDNIKKHYANTEGLKTVQEFFYSSGDMQVQGTHKGEGFTRSYDGVSLNAQGGWEIIEAWDFPGNVDRITRELTELMRSPSCPEGEFDLILAPSQLYLQTHENGHGFELDRILGKELSFAGGSFLRPEDVGKLQYGSKIVNIRANAHKEFGAGTFRFDDDGIESRDIYLVKEGIFNNVLSSRETVMEANLPANVRHSTGAMRAEDDIYIPLIRMTNIYLEPGNDGTIDDIISDTERGIVLETSNAWSIDNWRRNFLFGTEVGWRIVDGKKAQMVKTPIYQGETISFWNSCDKIGSHAEIRGVANCGKGQPMQSMYCGHPSPAARFKNVKIGVGTPGHSGGCRITDNRRISYKSMIRRGMKSR
ncbi:TldD/PmbA family protein [Candidatus Woesearchaeota archaeon]|nr:TldD/PmbA family protein [Candidatus Woesearchaeota archaeon]